MLLSELLVADERVDGVEPANDRRHYLLLLKAVSPQVPCKPSPDSWQRLGKAGHAVELVRVAHFAPARVVPVLLAPARVAAGRLEEAAAARRDQGVLPVWRHGQGSITT